MIDVLSFVFEFNRTFTVSNFAYQIDLVGDGRAAIQQIGTHPLPITYAAITAYCPPTQPGYVSTSPQYPPQSQIAPTPAPSNGLTAEMRQEIQVILDKRVLTESCE